MEFIQPTVDQRLLYPPFLASMKYLLSELHRKTGKRFVMVEGFRSAGRSHQLRKKALAGGPRSASAGLSFHNYGLAADFALDRDPGTAALEPNWKTGDYVVLVEEALRSGHHSGVSYSDSGHISWCDWEEEPGFVQKLATKWNSTHGGLGHILRLEEVWRYAEEIARSR